MSRVPVQEFESRATEAEKQIEILTKRIEFLEKALSSGNGKLHVLEQIQKGETGEAPVDTSELAKQNKEMKEERDKLRTDNAKLNYRIKHLLRNLQIEEDKNKSK